MNLDFRKNFKSLDLRYAYQLASELSEIIVSQDTEEKLEKYIWLYSKDIDEYFHELIDGGLDKILRPSKDTLLHNFISDIFNMTVDHEVYFFKDTFYDLDIVDIEQYLYENFISKLQCYKFNTNRFPVIIYNIFNDFEKGAITDKEYQEELKKYIDYLGESLKEIERPILDETFYLLFNDKKFLFEFNNFLAAHISRLDCELYKEIFDKGGNIKRCEYLPEWMRRAVFFRDNGVCQICGRDLSGFISVVEERGVHYDHIIPLEKGGVNDPTNFQLLCSDCNLHKSDKIKMPKYYYQYYW